VSDVARVVELAARDYSVQSHSAANPAAAIVIFQLPDPNAIEPRRRPGAKMEREEEFSPGVDYGFICTTVFAREIYHWRSLPRSLRSVLLSS